MTDGNDMRDRTASVLEKLDRREYPQAFASLCAFLKLELTPIELAARLEDCDKPKDYPPYLVAYITALLESEIALGNPYAMNNLGAFYYRGDRGFEQSFAKAVALYKMAAENGNRQAQENLGYCYYYGRDMDVDYEKAFHYFALGAFGGSLTSLYKIGDMYRHGLYVKKNEREAFLIYHRCLAQMTEADQAAVAGPVRLRLGDMYLNGIGTESSPEDALLHYSVAELALLQMVKRGDAMYKNGLRAAVRGQEAARAQIAKALPGREWTFDDRG